MSLEPLGPHPHVGRYGLPKLGRRHFGVPPGGAFDQELWQLANALIGNVEDEPAWEIAFFGLRARILAPCRLAILGASFSLDGVPGLGSIAHADTGQNLVVNQPYRARAYVAISDALGRREPRKRSLAMPDHRVEIRVVPSPGGCSLDGTVCRVSNKLDRVGIRLEGTGEHWFENRVSEPTCFGAVQATNDGQLIILGPDGPTVGGYPTQAVVCQADLDCLAQLRSGDEVQFHEVSLGEAREAHRQQRVAQENRLTSLR